VDKVLNIILAHQPGAMIERILTYWRGVASAENVLLAYGGKENDFESIAHEPKLFISDERLRTRDHQREAQSYSAVFKQVSDWLSRSSRAIDFLALFEFDHLPLVRDLNARQISRMQAEGADVLGYHLARVDNTSHPHYLHYAANSEFARFFKNLSVRDDPYVVLTMFGTGSCWTREAFDSMANFDEPFPVYFEIYLPTLAHHLGFRLRDYGDQDRFISNLGDRSGEVELARSKGAWTLHPVKTLPIPISSMASN
jgi:hypothetical protein